MASIDIRKSHSLGLDTAKKRAEDLARGMESKLGISWSWDGDHIQFSAPSGPAKGTSGTVKVDDASVRVEIDLPFLMRPLKGSIESKVKEKLEQVLGA